MSFIPHLTSSQHTAPVTGT